MQNKEKQQLIVTGLGAACTGLGLMFTLFPGFMNRAAGFGLEKGPGMKVVLRLVGMRDVAFGIGILSSRNNPKVLDLWLNLLALIAGSDVIAFGLTLPKAKNKPLTLLTMTTSAGAVFLSLTSRKR